MSRGAGLKGHPTSYGLRQQHLVNKDFVLEAVQFHLCLDSGPYQQPLAVPLHKFHRWLTGSDQSLEFHWQSDHLYSSYYVQPLGQAHDSHLALTISQLYSKHLRNEEIETQGIEQIAQGTPSSPKSHQHLTPGSLTLSLLFPQTLKFGAKRINIRWVPTHFNSQKIPRLISEQLEKEGGNVTPPNRSSQTGLIL